jgi:SAM-dependent methyltransferase
LEDTVPGKDQPNRSAPAQPSLRNRFLKAVNNSRCRAWDLIHGVDTCGEISLESFNFESKNKTPGLEYQSHHPRLIRNGLKASGIEFHKYIFIDYGCGKGRALLVASEFPFRKIIGMEFVPQLADIARANIRRFGKNGRLCSDIEVVTGDATEYQLPLDPAFLYFYSPFSTPVMETIFRNIESSLEQSPRELVVLFTGLLAKRDRAFGRPPYERVIREQYFDIYRRRGAPTAYGG